MSSVSAHLEEMERVPVGQPSDRDDLVINSWLRCMNEYRLDPTQRGMAYGVSATRLREHQQQAEELARISRSALDHLYAQVAGTTICCCPMLVACRWAHYRNPNLDNVLRAAGLVSRCGLAGKPDRHLCRRRLPDRAPIHYRASG